jgi:hypothetical protein
MDDSLCFREVSTGQRGGFGTGVFRCRGPMYNKPGRNSNKKKKAFEERILEARIGDISGEGSALSTQRSACKDDCLSALARVLSLQL